MLVVVELRARSGLGLLGTVPDDNSHSNGLLLKHCLFYHLWERTKNHNVDSAIFSKLVGKIVILIIFTTLL